MTLINQEKAPETSAKRNHLEKLGDALKPSAIIHHFKRSDDKDGGSQEKGRANDHDDHATGPSNAEPNGQSNSSDQQKQERIKAEKEDVKRHRDELDRQAAREDSPEMLERYGELNMPGEISSLEEVVKMHEGEQVTFRARIHVQRAVSSRLDFIVFRQRGLMIQGVLHDDCSEHMIKWVERLPSETIVQVSGTLRQPPTPLKASLDTQLELSVEEIHLVELAHEIPFRLSDSTTPPQSLRLGIEYWIYDILPIKPLCVYGPKCSTSSVMC
jgi:aspartyl-tRNA synthetase